MTSTSQLSRRDQDGRADAASTPAPCVVARDADPAWKRVAAATVL